MSFGYRRTHAPRPAACEACPIGHVTQGFTHPSIGTGTELWVGEAAGEQEAYEGSPFVGTAGSWLDSMLRNARIPRKTITIANVCPCQPPDNVFPGSADWTATDRATAHRAVEYCKSQYLYPLIAERKPSRIVALGGEALRALTTRTGILQWRGSVLPYRHEPEAGPKVVPTLHPAYLGRVATLFSVAVRDIKRTTQVPPENYDLYPSIETVRAFTATRFAFDFEWEPSTGAITMCGLSDRWYHAIVVPFVGEYIPELKRIFESAEVIIGHNIVDADTWYFEQLGWNVTAKLNDTMLAQHLVQPDMRHGLGFVASVFTSKVFWKGQGEETEDEDGTMLATGAQWKTWDSPDAIPRAYGGYGGCHSADEAWRLYNARDTDGSLQCEGPVFSSLEHLGLANTYWNVSVPAAFICRDMNRTGLKFDRSRIAGIRTKLDEQITEKETLLPEGLKPYDKAITKQVPAPAGTYKPKTVKCKGTRKAGTAHEVVEISVTTPGGAACPTCGKNFTPKLTQLKRIKVPATKRIVPWNSTAQVMVYARVKGCKQVAHLKTGNDTGDKRARKIWGREHKEFAIVDDLKKDVTRRNGFAKAAFVDWQYEHLDRVFFRLAVTGTAEGRLSCSGQPPFQLNLQNQPKMIRSIFVPDEPGQGILNSDLVQGENMLTAWLAKDWVRWERLLDESFSEHCHMGRLFFNCPVNKKLPGTDQDDPYYKAAKSINHGKNYGLGVKKIQDQIFVETGRMYSLADVREMDEIWRKENARTAVWQQETIQQAERQGYLDNPFGRRRWFSVKRDLAGKALAFLPASTLADAVLRMMTGLHPNRFPNEIAALRLGRTAELLPGWRMALQVHDSLVHIGPADTHQEMAARVAHVMCQPWPELGGFAFRVDQEFSTDSWGDCKTLELQKEIA